METDNGVSTLSLEEQIRSEVAKQLRESSAKQRGLTIVAFSGDMDRLLAALTMANTAAASGKKTTIFFTFWGVCALKVRTRFRGKGLVGRMLSMMLPRGPKSLGTSRMNMAGVGPRFFHYVMKKKHVAGVPQALDLAEKLGVELVACSTSMEIMAIDREELRPGVTVQGAPSCVHALTSSAASLFV